MTSPGDGFWSSGNKRLCEHLEHRYVAGDVFASACKLDQSSACCNASEDGQDCGESNGHRNMGTGIPNIRSYKLVTFMKSVGPLVDSLRLPCERALPLPRGSCSFAARPSARLHDATFRGRQKQPRHESCG